MFKRVLVANRGEIAFRIIRTLRRLGIEPVLVASIPDRHSLAARHAGHVVVLDGYTPAETYLDQDAVIAATKSTACEAIHPGYGFLAENASFADRCAAEGIAFIGPTGDVLRQLGSKTAARALAEKCQVAVVPGYDGDDDDRSLVDAAHSVGFPVMVKARAGGGGRGMRVVRDPADLPEAISSARREATAAFGDGSLFLERLIENAHHVEVQVLADAHGNLLHLGERDCSVQRRHQKIIEEAPSPVVDEDLRSELTSAALSIARAARYLNAGTFEFLVGAPPEGGRRPFWFIEANPRLQVEHPVTEAITGLDIVELQLRIAAGESLPLSQRDVRFDGHAIELRINAEDPANAFAPSAGRLRTATVSTRDASGTRLRLDSGYEAGDTVPAQYDSLLAKAVAHSPGRDAAIAALGAATCSFDPLATNAGLLQAVLAHPDFASGAVHVEWLEANLESVLSASAASAEALAAAAVFAWASRDAYWLGAGQLALWLDDGAGKRCVHLTSRDHAGLRVSVGNTPYAVRVTDSGDSVQARVDDQLFTVTREGSEHIRVDGQRASRRFTISLPPPLPREARPSVPGATAVTAPLSGTVAAVYVAAGDTVDAGQLLLTLEAMKMEHRLVAPAPGTVASLTVQAGDSVAQGHVLVELGE